MTTINESLINLNNKEVKSLKKLMLDSGKWQTEEEVRKAYLKEIESLLEIDFHAERERNDARLVSIK